jgi:hypothetical protein
MTPTARIRHNCNAARARASYFEACRAVVLRGGRVRGGAGALPVETKMVETDDRREHGQRGSARPLTSALQ